MVASFQELETLEEIFERGYFNENDAEFRTRIGGYLNVECAEVNKPVWDLNDANDARHHSNHLGNHHFR